MKQFYIHHNGEQLGPLSVDQIKSKNISRTTMVWCEGLPDWIPADEVEELAMAFSTPPPLQSVPVSNSFTGTPPPYQVSENIDYDEPRILGLKKNEFFIVAGIVLLAAVFFIYRNYQSHRSVDIMEQVTNAEQNDQLIEQQAQIDAQNAAIAEQQARLEAQEAQRKEKEREQKLEKLNQELEMNRSNVEIYKYNLREVSKFKLMRSQNQRDIDISQVQNQIDHAQAEVWRLEKEIEALQ